MGKVTYELMNSLVVAQTIRVSMRRRRRSYRPPTAKKVNSICGSGRTLDVRPSGCDIRTRCGEEPSGCAALPLGWQSVTSAPSVTKHNVEPKAKGQTLAPSITRCAHQRFGVGRWLSARRCVSVCALRFSTSMAANSLSLNAWTSFRAVSLGSMLSTRSFAQDGA